MKNTLVLWLILAALLAQAYGLIQIHQTLQTKEVVIHLTVQAPETDRRRLDALWRACGMEPAPTGLSEGLQWQPEKLPRKAQRP
jgi:hypothetical protein